MVMFSCTFVVHLAKKIHRLTLKMILCKHIRWLLGEILRDFTTSTRFKTPWTNPNPQIVQGLYINTPGLFVG
jgi:hypothetical protein